MKHLFKTLKRIIKCFKEAVFNNVDKVEHRNITEKNSASVIQLLVTTIEENLHEHDPVKKKGNFN